MKTNQNLLLMTDVYKLNHMNGYKPGITKVYSYLCARSDKKEKDCMFFGLQPYIKMFERGISQEDANEFFEYYEMILGTKPQEDIVTKIQELVDLGYIPLEIKAVPEGTIIDTKNVLITVTNSDPRFFWVVGFFESLLLKVWNTCSVATRSLKYKRIASKYLAETSDKDFLLPFLVHDFGYRGVSSEQTAELSGAAHLINFLGTDTIPAVKFLKENYEATGLIGASVYATEHSLHCSFGPSEQDEYDYVEHQLNKCPTGICSLVSDAFDYWRMLTVTLPKFKDRILSREGQLVVRPDSGVPELILMGNPDAPVGSPEFKGTFQILEDLFGAEINSKGYKTLNPKIGVIYGDAMYVERYERVFEMMKQANRATELVIGSGGLLLQQHNRDDLGFAFKATFATINGENVELYKDPITDPGKRSHKGLMCLMPKDGGGYVTLDQVDETMEQAGELVTVFKDGVVTKSYTLAEIRERAKI